MIPLGYMIRHPVKAYKLYKYDKVTTNLSKSFANGNIRPTVNEEMFIREQLQNIRRGIGRELSPTELKQFDNLFRKSWKEVKVMEAGYKVLPEDIKVEILTEVKGFIDMVKQGKTPDEIKQHYENAAKVAATAVVATQAPTAKEYNDASQSSFKSKKGVYDSIPSTRSAGVGSRVSSPETFKNGVVNMARTVDASAGQISKLLKMDAKLLEELYYDKPFLFDLYFEYSLYDDFAPSHEDSGINKLIESYEYKFGVTL